MDLKIDAEKIRSLRSGKAWSQEHLALVSNLGRRTIQRVEKSGTASYETAQAIASAFDLNVSDLTETENLKINALQERNSLLRRTYMSLTSLVLLVLFAISGFVSADQIKMDIQAIVDDEHQTEATVSNEEGEGSQVQLAGDYRILVTPSVTNQRDIQLELVLMKLEGEEYERVASPTLRTPDGQTAMIKSTMDDGQTLTLEITPKIQ